MFVKLPIDVFLITYSMGMGELPPNLSLPPLPSFGLSPLLESELLSLLKLFESSDCFRSSKLSSLLRLSSLSSPS